MEMCSLFFVQIKGVKIGAVLPFPHVVKTRTRSPCSDFDITAAASCGGSSSVSGRFSSSPVNHAGRQIQPNLLTLMEATAIFWWLLGDGAEGHVTVQLKHLNSHRGAVPAPHFYGITPIRPWSWSFVISEQPPRSSSVS